MKRPGTLIGIAFGLWAVGLGHWALAANAQTAPGRTVWDGVYTSAQAERGSKLFAENCSACHGAEMKAGPGAPSLVGPEFQFSWDKKSVGGLFDYARMFMPPGQTGALRDEQYADIVAAILKGNGFPASETAQLPAIKADLDAIQIREKP
jgi:S-disulfanyl-L-cysteine oxidoreductase SoxD